MIVADDKNMEQSAAEEISTKETYQMPEENLAIPKLPEFHFVSADLPDGARRVTAEGQGPKQGFEITISDYDESGPITAERIKKDIPDLVVKNHENIKIAGGVEAFSFFGHDDGLGETFEVWFSAQGKLYQVVTWAEYKKELLNILQSIEL